MRLLLPALLSLNLLAGAPPAPVVVELFTSEGCSSCPPADELLLRLEKEPGVIALGFHVDYWDHLGWKDPFSRHAFTERQFAYAQALRQDSTYTPELVVDGREGFVGSSSGDARRAIAESRRRPKLPVALASRGGRLEAELPGLSSGRGLEVWLAVSESGIQSSVLRGENRGRQLHHAAVVRHLEKVAHLEGGGSPRSLAMDVLPEWRERHWRAVLLVQDPATREIVGAASADL